MRLTDLEFDMIQSRANDLAGLDVWADGDEIGGQLRADLGRLIDEVERLRAKALPTVIIHVEGGVIQAVESDQSEAVRVLVHDEDAEPAGGVSHFPIDHVGGEDLANWLRLAEVNQ